MLTASVLRSMMRVVGFCSAAWMAMAATTSVFAAVSAYDGFDPNLDGNVYAIALQPDGKVIAAGHFAWARPNGTAGGYARNNIARFNADGTVDTAFQPSVDGQINSVALQADGGIVIGGTFTKVGSTTRINAARLKSDGSLDATFNPAPGGSLAPDVKVVFVESNGQILVGGGFYTVQGLAADASPHYLARFNADGTLDSTFRPNPNGMVLAVAEQADGKLVLGGDFTTLQPAGSDATTHSHIARITAAGALDTAFGPAFDTSVRALAIDDYGRIVVGGTFSTATSTGHTTTISRAYAARLSKAGVVDPTFAPSPVSAVLALSLGNDGGIVLAGGFGATRYTLAGAYSSRILVGTNADVLAVATQHDGSVVLGGKFNSVYVKSGASVTRNHLCRLTYGGDLDATFNPLDNGRPYAVEIQSDGKILIGGTFTNIGGVNHRSLARISASGTLDSSFNADTDGQIYVIKELSDGKILIGGTFSYVNGSPNAYLARLNADGSLDSSFAVRPNSAVRAIAVQSDGKIVLGGAFTTLKLVTDESATARDYIGRINADGTIDADFDPVASASVLCLQMAADGTSIYVGGSFTQLQPNSGDAYVRYYLAKLKSDGKVDSDFRVNASSAVYALALASDGGLIVGGGFTAIASPADTYTRNRIFKVSADGVIDPTFDPSANASVTSIAAEGDQMIIAGRFTELSPNGGATAPRNYLARINADGTIDDTFNVNIDNLPGNEVTAVAVQSSDNSVVFTGTFNTVKPTGSTQAVRRNRLVRITQAGALDPSVNVDITGLASPDIRAIGVDGDGSILVAGQFSDYNGAIGASVARFYSDSSPDSSFSSNVDGTVNAFATLPSAGSTSTQMSGFGAFSTTAALDQSFTPGAGDVFSGSVYAMATESDGSILLGGTYTFPTDRTTPIYLSRYSRTGVRDQSFKPIFNGIVTAMQLQSDGKILVGGSFTTVNGVAKPYFARLNADGTLDTTFVTTVSASVNAIALTSDNFIIIGGAFTTMQDTSDSLDYFTRYHLAKLALADGKVDKDFNPNADGTVRAVAIQSDGKILVGGDFTSFTPNSASEATSRLKLARLNADGTLDDTFKPSPDASVYTILVQSDGKIMIGGLFQTIGTAPHGYIARINADGSLDNTFTTIANAAVTCLIPEGTNYVFAGSFTYLGYASDSENFIARGYIARVSQSTGKVDETFAPSLSSSVYALGLGANPEVIYVGGFLSSIQSTAAYVIGGNFTQVNSASSKNLALISSHGSLNGTFTPNPNGAVNVVLRQADGRLLVAGAFTKIAGKTRNRLAYFRADQTLDTTVGDLAIDQDVTVAAALPDGSALIGGAFTQAGGASHSYLAKITAAGVVDSSFNPTIGGPVAALAVQPDGAILYTETVNGVARLKRLLADGTADSGFTSAVTGSVASISVQADGHIFVGGSFTGTSGGKAYNYVARLTSTGGLDTSYRPVFDKPVTTLSLQSDGKLLVGGSFTSIGSLPRYGLGRLSATGLSTDTFSINDTRSAVSWTLDGSAGTMSSMLVEKSSDESTWTELGAADYDTGTHTWTLTGFSVPSRETISFRFRGAAPTGSGTSTGYYQRTYSVYPDPNPVLKATDLPAASVDSVYHYQLRASDDPTSFKATGLPPGLTLDAKTGVISGTPTAAGTYQVVVTVSNGSYSTATTITITVNPPSAPDAPVATAAANVDADAFDATWGAVATADGYKVDVATDAAFTQSIGTYSVTDPTATSQSVTGLTASKTYYYRVRAYNNIGTSANSNTISVKTLANKAPKITSTASTTFTATLVCQFTFKASGAPSPTFTATGLPSWAKLDADSGILSGKAPASAVGAIIPLAVTATNGISPASTQAFTLNVAAVPTIANPLLVSTIAGKAGSPGGTNGLPADARFNAPSGITVNSSDLIFLTDTDNHAVRKIADLDWVTRIAGKSGTSGTANGTASDARFNSPSAIVSNGVSTLYVADTLNHTIRQVTTDGVVTTLAGGAEESGSVDAVGTAARFFGPQGVALSISQGALFVADTNNHTIRKIDLDTLAVTTVAGLAGVTGSADGTGSVARFNAPTGIAIDSSSTIFVADTDNNTIRSISIDGVVKTIAGRAGATGAADGTGTAARFNHPSALAIEGDVLYILDSDNHTVRELDTGNNTVTTIGGKAGVKGSADGLGDVARFNEPTGIAVNSDGELFISDTGNHTIRMAVFPAAPVITSQPLARSVQTGSSATFSVVATGEPKPTYQWMHEGAAIDGATDTSYTIDSATVADAGKYSVVVTNSSGSVTSDEVTLSVDSTTSGGTGGGGGAPSLWFLAALVALVGGRRWSRHRRAAAVLRN